MTSRSDHHERELAELSALADGSLEPARRADVRARIAASPELSALLEREQRVVKLVAEARTETRAPASLRARIEAQRPRASGARRRTVYIGGLTAALAAVVLALVLILPAGTPGSPSVSQAAALAGLGPAAPAPVTDSSEPQKLDTKIENLYFPNWESSLHWRAVGQRSDRIDGRLALTVYYSWHGKRVAYTIVGSPALDTPASQVRTLNGTELHTLRLGARLVVTWRRAGHTCVLSGPGVAAVVLEQLAAWKSPGTSA